MSKSRFALFLSAALTLSTFASASDEPTFEQRLEKLTETLEAARVRGHIPGMSIAIVKDDEVVFARGFGFADVETERLADEGTIYAIGSTTKAMTATTIAEIFVDEDGVRVEMEIGPADLKAFAENLKDRMLRFGGIPKIDIKGFSDHQIRIELPDAVIRQYGISISDVARAIQQRLDIRIGEADPPKTLS